MEKVTVFEDKILIKPVEEEKKEGLIIIPKTINKNQTKGLVVKVGPGTIDIPILVKEGDYVYYNSRAGTEIEIDDVVYVLLRQSDLYFSVHE